MSGFPQDDRVPSASRPDSLPDLLKFATLQREATLSGVGLHSGQPVTARLIPSNRVGIVFVRLDLPGQPEIPAAWDRVGNTYHATTLRLGEASVATIEHLLAVLAVFGITHCRIELDGSEVPILDGSAQPWCALLREAGRRELTGTRPTYTLREPVWIEEGGASVLGLPAPENEFRISYAVDFGVGYRQVIDFTVEPARFERELAPARTFAREEWLSALRERGLIRGGSTENAVLLRDDGPSEAWRVADELARHKALDAIGDLALLTAPQGARLRAHIVATRAGHGLHRAWIGEALRCDALVLEPGIE